MRFHLPLATALVALTPLTAGCGVETLLAQREAFTKANFSFSGVELLRTDIPLLTPNAKADLNVKLAVQNPNPIAAALDALDFQLYMDDAPVGSGRVAEAFSVPAGETRTLAIPVSVPYLDLPAAALAALQKREARFTLKGTSRFQTLLGPLSFPVELSHTARF